MTSRTSSRPSSHRRRAWASGAAAATFLLGIGVGVLWQRLEPPAPPATAPAPPACPPCPLCPSSPSLAHGAKQAAAAPKRLRKPPEPPSPVPLPEGADGLASDEDRLRAWMATQAEALATCSSPAEDRARGHALLELDVAPDGRVRHARLLARDAVPAPVETCILARARTWRAPIASENRLLVKLVL